MGHLVEGVDAGLAGPPPYRELGDQQREPEEKGEDDVDEEEYPSAVLLGQIREAPEVPEADGRARGGEYETYLRGESCPACLVVHGPHMVLDKK